MDNDLVLTGSTFYLLATHLDDYNVDVIIALLTNQFPKRLAILPSFPLLTELIFNLPTLPEPRLHLNSSEIENPYRAHSTCENSPTIIPSVVETMRDGDLDGDTSSLSSDS